MIYLKKSIRFLLRFLLGFVCFVIIYLCMAWLLPHFKANPSFVESSQGVEIFIQSNGVHTDFVLPVKNDKMDWSKYLPYADFEKADSTFKYISLGWGDKGFFIGTPTWADLKFSTAFKAAFALSSTAMHVSYKRYKPNTDELCKRLIISEKQYQSLIDYIQSSFQHYNKKCIAIDHPGYSDFDCFYEANGTYSLFKTCNVWTGEGLKRSGIKVGVWTPFHKGVLNSIE
jgi:uncharacterized protein (TIGR02117 family)